jgi:glycosyltransferase involved in cell wall biosynthesis
LARVSRSLALAHVSPYAWEDDHAVVRHITAVTAALAARGHRVLVVAPSHSTALVRESRRAIRAARDDPEGLLPDPGAAPRVLGVGEVVALSPSRRRSPSLPIDVARTIEQALTGAALDIVHVHEPFAPSTASAALRHSRALNVGTFHAPTERVLATQLGRRVTELLLGRLDARLVSYGATAELLHRYFPAEYRVVLPGVAPPVAPPDGASGPTFAFVDEEERGARRLFLRALRRLPIEEPWTARVWSARESPPAGAMRREVFERIEWVNGSPEAAVAGAEVAVLGSAGELPAPAGLRRALAAGVVPVASRLAVYEELLADGERGLLFEPGDVEVLAAQMARLAGDAPRRERLRAAAGPVRGTLDAPHVAAELEGVYAGLVARRHDGREQPELRARMRGRPFIDVDLHMHTDHSHDCATPVEVLLAQAKERGLGAIAVTDHNEISGAREARAKAEGIKVIVAEEIKTGGQGEVIGLFIEEKIPRGLTLSETIAEIKRQGGVVYVPHPFDRMHSVPDYEHLLPVIDDVDAIEIFNPRIAIPEFNEEAVRFAAKYRIPGGAGSDAHVPQGLGSVRIRMRDFDGPEEFLESLREADVIRRPASLLYVQALKFLQTKATPAPARAAVRARRVRRAARKS